jgi:signal transduction histidine kinase
MMRPDTPETNAHSGELLVFAEEKKNRVPENPLRPWKLLIADDDEGVHAVTRNVLEDFNFEGRGFTYLNAYSGKEAMQIFQENPDTALILLDVVMETDHAGLDVIRYIRQELDNPFVRIILYTGQPGMAPERDIILNYDINDYKVKSMLTSQELYTAVITAMRAYRDLRLIEKQRDDLEQAMEEAQVAHNARYQFLANMGHELRTPLNHILGFTEILLHTSLTEQQQNYIRKMKKSGESLCTVLNNILELSELTAGKNVLNEAPFFLRKMITETMEIMDTQAEWKNLRTSYHIADDIPDYLLGDGQRLKQVLMNLIGNAIRYTQRGHIKLNISRLEGHSIQVLFAVQDTGIGIKKDKQGQIFQPFALGEDALKKEFSGAGVGLAISKRLIESMNGKMWFQSTSGQGSTFYFSLELKKG